MWQVLEWTNEHSLSGYPLASRWLVNDFIVDASFVQFDNFIPVLKTLQVTDTSVILTLLFESETVAVTVSKDDTYVNINDSSGRRLGNLTFGTGLITVWDNYIGTTTTIDIPFLATTVTSISSSYGVYSMEGLSGAVQLYSGADKLTQNIFFDIDGQEITWHAAALPNAVTINPLKSLNGCKPLNNHLFLQDSDIIKIKPMGEGLQVSMASSPEKQIISPTS